MIDPKAAEALRYPLLVLGILSAVFSVLLLAITWQSIPKSVPTHFGLSGRPDNWGGKWIFFLLLAVQAGVLIPLMLVPDNDLMAAWCMSFVSVLLAYAVWGTIQVAQQQADRLNPVILYGLLGLVVIPPMLKGILTGK